MLAKNTEASVATVAVALIAGVMVALLLALMPAPAQAQSGDVLRLLSLKVEDITDDEHACVPVCIGDFADEPYIKVDGATVWYIGANNSMKNGDIVNLAGVSAPLSGANAQVQVWERDPGIFQAGDDLIGEFNAAYTDGTEQTQPLSYRNGEAVYVIRYVVERPSTPGGGGTGGGGTGGGSAPANTSPTIDPIKPAPGSKTRDRTPLIEAKVSDVDNNLVQSGIKLFVDSKSIANFSWNHPGTDQLSYQSGKLNRGQHTVRIEATDDKGLQTVKDWSFKVVKKVKR